MYLYALVIIAVATVAIKKIPKWDLRWAPMIVMAKGVLIFTCGILLLALSKDFVSTAFSQLLNATSIVCFVIGFAIIAYGFVIGTRVVFGATDLKREVDPGYELGDILCPHCQKVQMRKDSKVVKCPNCKKKTKVEDF